MNYIETLHGKIVFPAFLPDATRAVVKSVDSFDLINSKIEGIVVNTYHLFNSHLVSTIKQFGGIHCFMNWNRPIISDSGGFQVMSLIRDNSKYGKILDDKIIFKINKGKKIIFTPEKSIQIQLKLKSDIIMCLDDCTRPNDAPNEQRKSVERTVNWAKKCKSEFDKLSKNQKDKPLIFAIIQGGDDKDLRKECAGELVKMGFDGYGFGGFPIDKNKNLVSDILKFTADLMPNDLPKYAMGIGSPEHLVGCFKMGYNLFDCVIPTRNARHKKLYIFEGNIKKMDILNNKNFYSSLYLDNIKLMKDKNPISAVCDCQLCKNYSRAYLYSLFKANDCLATRLATMHNLRFYSKLIELLRNSGI